MQPGARRVAQLSKSKYYHHVGSDARVHQSGPAGWPEPIAASLGLAAESDRDQQAAQHAVDRLGLGSSDHHHPIIDQTRSRQSSELKT